MVSPRRVGASEGTAGRLASPLAERMRCGRSIGLPGVIRADAGNALVNGANEANAAITSRIFLTRRECGGWR